MPAKIRNRDENRPVRVRRQAIQHGDHIHHHERRTFAKNRMKNVVHSIVPVHRTRGFPDPNDVNPGTPRNSAFNIAVFYIRGVSGANTGICPPHHTLNNLPPETPTGTVALNDAVCPRLSIRFASPLKIPENPTSVPTSIFLVFPVG